MTQVNVPLLLDGLKCLAEAREDVPIGSPPLDWLLLEITEMIAGDSGFAARVPGDVVFTPAIDERLDGLVDQLLSLDDITTLRQLKADPVLRILLDEAGTILEMAGQVL